jgi:hypothetical protein
MTALKLPSGSRLPAVTIDLAETVEWNRENDRPIRGTCA